MTDYIKRSDAARAMAQYMMDTALIDNPEASDRIEQWEGNIAAPVMSTVKAADVRDNIKAYWKNINDEYYSCSYCGGCADIAYHYCPWCGADMRGGA